MSSIGAQIDQAVATVTDSFQRIFFDNRSHRVLPFVTAGALALVGMSFIGSNARKPRIAKAPAPQKTGIYPYDVFENGKLLDTPYGRIRSYEVGPESGEKLLLVHGISTPAPVWGGIVPQLVKAGFRVLIYDLYGRGYSDSPAVPHDNALFISQIALLLAALPNWDKFSIVGMSLGGPIAAGFAFYYPERINKVFLLCPAGGTPSGTLPLTRKIFLTLPPSMMRTFVSGGPINPARDQSSIGYWQATNHPGFWFSFISSMRHGPIFDQSENLKLVTQYFGSRLKAIWGDADDIVPIETKKYFGKMEVEVVPGGGHWIVSSHADIVAASIIKHCKA